MVIHHAGAGIYYSPCLFTTAHLDFVNLGKTSWTKTVTGDKTVISFSTPRRVAVGMEKLSTGHVAWFWKTIFSGFSFVVFCSFLFSCSGILSFLFGSRAGFTVHTSLTRMQTWLCCCKIRYEEEWGRGILKVPSFWLLTHSTLMSRSSLICE